METIPAIVKDIEMDDAIVMMVDSNFQRQSLLPSEKARAYKMKLDAVKRQGARRDLSSDHDEQKLRGKTSRDLIAENSPDSSTQIERFIRLNELIPELLEMVDNKRIGFVVGVDISFFDKEVQKWICEYIHDNGVLKQEQIVALKARLEQGPINQRQMIIIQLPPIKKRHTV